MQWKTIPGFSRFEVSEYGDIRCAVAASKSPLGPRKTRVHNRYLMTSIQSDTGKVKNLAVHRAVAFAFLGPPPSPAHQVAHGDGDHLNNYVGNLRWATPRENIADRTKHGKTCRGETQGSSVLTEEQVREILASPQTGRALAARFGVSESNIGHIRAGRQWAHIEGERSRSTGNRRLIEADVIEIRQSDAPIPELARRYGVHRMTIDRVLSRETWKHVR